MKTTIRIIAIAFSALLLMCCGGSKRYLSKLPHIRWTGQPTGLSEKLNIDGCFYGDNSGDPIHFDDYGFAVESQGYVPGAYILNGDTITVEWYSRWDMFYRQWERRTAKYCIVSSDTIKYLGGMVANENNPEWGYRPAKNNYIYVRFDCPDDFKVHDGFLRKQKWMWESEEARKEWERKQRDK